MKDDLIKLRNTLMLISTRGEDTKIMGKCLDFLEELIVKANIEIKKESEVYEENGTGELS